MKTVKPTLPGLRRAFQVIRPLATHPEGYAFNALQRLCDGVPAPTLSRLLKALIQEGMVAKDPENGRYKVGAEFVTLARRTVRAMPKADVVQPILDRLAGDAGHSSAYWEFVGDATRLVAKSVQENAFSYIRVGKRNYNLTRHGFGQVCLAYQDEKRLAPLLAARRDQLRGGETRFRRRLAAIRAKGVLVDLGESHPVLRWVVAPVICGERVVGSVGVTMLPDNEERGRLPHIRAAVREAARDAASALEAIYGEDTPTAGRAGRRVSQTG